MLDFGRARRTMVDCQLRPFDITDRAVLAAMGEVPRERFMPAGRQELAYSDQTVTLPETVEGSGSRFLLAPMVLARMIQALAIEDGSRVLDVASATGYASAVLARLGARVVALDDAGRAAQALHEPDLAERVTVRSGPVAAGAPDDGPFDAILVNGAVEIRPDALLDQLADGGRLACLSREGGACRAVLYVRSGEAVGSRPLFEAGAPVLQPFRVAAAFAF